MTYNHQINVPSYDQVFEQPHGEQAYFAHLGDPCQFCGQEHDEVAIGSCPGRVVAANIRIYKEARREQLAAQYPWAEIMDHAKAIVAENLLHLPGGRFKGEEGQAYIPKDGVSVKYDAQALDRLCAANPALAAVLSPFRSQTIHKGSLTIR